MGNATRTAPWPGDPIEVKADGQAPTRLYANENGYVAVELKELPIKLSQRSNDLVLSISAPGGTVAAAESVTVPVSTMVAWEQKEAVRAKLEEENKAQAERTRLAQEAREQAAQARSAEEKRLASIKTAALAAAPPAKSAAKTSSGSGSEASAGSINPDASSARVCDTQCGMIVAESRCNQVQDNQANLSCKAKNGMMLPDTPELCAAAKALSGCVTQAEKEAAQKQEIPRTPSNYQQVLKTSWYARESVCDLATAEWDERNKGHVNDLSRRLFHTGQSFTKELEIQVKILKLCAKDDTEFQKLADHRITILEKNKDERGVNCGGRLGNGGPNDARFASELVVNIGTEQERMSTVKNYLRNRHCKTLPPEAAALLDEFSAKYEQNGLAALEWAKSVKVDHAAESARSQSPEEQACAASLKSLEKQFDSVQRKIPSSSVVVRSESVLWVATESIAKIKAQCPQSATYQRQIAQLETTYRETQRVCDAHASTPPLRPAPAW